MQTECSPTLFEFEPVERHKVVAGFDGGIITSDAGGLLLGRLDRGLGLIRRMASCFTDRRDPRLLEHTVETLVGQRVFALALGYEDLNDHDELRHDPLFHVLAGKLEAKRSDCAPVAGKSTLNRLEHRPRREAGKYHKIDYDAPSLEALFVDIFLDGHKRAPKEIVLDLDATDDTIHGEQEGRFFHGYYDSYCYLPLYIFCGRFLLGAKLRPANIDGAAGAVDDVARIVARIRARWPKVRIVLRGDSGFCREELMAWCEAEGVAYLFGLAPNARLKAVLAPEAWEAARLCRTTGKAARLTGADIRAKLDHPVVDADGHMIEATFAVFDFVKQVGGAKMLERYEKMVRPNQPGRRRGAVWIGNSGAGTIDRATAMLPKLLYSRLDELGIDFAVVYGTYALNVLGTMDDEMRPVIFRAMNMLYADMFNGLSDRLTPVALIPMHKPEEALAELDFAVGELGLKAIVMNCMLRRPAEEVMKTAPELAPYAIRIDSPAIDVGTDYDPVWAKCIELGVAPTCHNAFRGIGSSHGSPSNYVFNSLGSFAQGSDHFCRSLIMGGVPIRFPELRYAFLEGGTSWAAQLYNSLFEYWEKRNLTALRETLDPAALDVDLLVDMFGKYGNDYLTAERIKAWPHHSDGASSPSDLNPEDLDDFGAAGITKPEDIRDMFVNNFYFGSEADDRMTAVGFDPKFNHYGIKMKAILGSDIGHWDVPDMTKVLVEAYELVDDGYLDDADFRDFIYGNVVEMHTSMNPDFFNGTVIEDEVEKFKSENAVLAAE